MTFPASATILKAVFEHTPFGLAVYVLARNGTEGSGADSPDTPADYVCIRHNRAFLALAAAPAVAAGSIEGVPLRALFDATAYSAVRAAFDEVHGSGVARTIDELPTVLLPDPRPRYYRWSLTPVRHGEAVQHIVVSAVEITELVLARQRTAELSATLASDRARFQQVLDVFPEGVAIADATGQVVLSNATARSIWGQGPPAVDAHQYEAFGAQRLDGSPYPSEALPLARSVLRGEVVRGDQFFLRNQATGQLQPVLASSAPLFDDAGAVTGGVVVFQDMSPIKDMEHQQDAFLATVFHDLKNPLAAISVRAQVLQREAARVSPPGETRLLDGLQAIRDLVTRSTSTLDDLLDVTRMQMGRPLELRRQLVDVGALARQVANEHQRGTRRHTIQVDAPDDHPATGFWDPTRLTRVLDNLVSNAVKYSPNGGTIQLEVTSREGAAMVQVRDEGIGIPAAELPRVFERFYRGSNVSGQIQGNGLGLAGARHIVERLGGTLSAESVEGTGSTFTLRLPLDAPPST